ncbi:hypothetical protein B0H13DRAFT_2313662 [Mycena leptocephala]|nr:hypothetical protein B0H13DRAFT_2313662 [Mycena leptocephala]
MLPPQLSPSTNPVPRIVILSTALSVSHRSPHSGPCHWKRYPISPIFHGPQPSHQPLIPPACVHLSTKDYFEEFAASQRCAAQGEEGGEKMEPGRMREGRIGFHNRPGVDSTMGWVDIGLGIHWRLTLLPPLPALPSYLNPQSFLPPTHPRLNLPRPPRTRTRADIFIPRAQTPREVSLFPLFFILVSVCLYLWPGARARVYDLSIICVFVTLVSSLYVLGVGRSALGYHSMVRANYLENERVRMRIVCAMIS